MIEIDVLTQIVKKAEKQGAKEAEAFYSDKTELQIRAKKKQVKIGEHKRDIGVGLRVATKKNGSLVTGFSFTTDFSEEAIEGFVKQALKTCLAKKPDPDFKGFSEKRTYKNIPEIFDKKLVDTQPDEVIDLVDNQMKLASADKRVETVTGLTSLLVNEIAVVNSNGISGGYKTSNFYSTIYVLAKEADSSGVGSFDYSNCFYEEKGPTKVAEDALELAIQQLNPKSLKAETMDLVMSPEAFAGLMIYVLVQELRADLVQKLQSPLADKLNQKIASEALTITNDPNFPKAVGSRPFDDEGVPSTKCVIIDKGVLKSYLYHTYSAKKEGVENTGNALRYALLQIIPKYRIEPFIGPSNIVIKPGTTSKEKIIDEVSNGILTNNFMGVHTASPQSGNFSIAPYCAFKIENGEVKYPIKEAMIGGNILNLLQNVEVVGNDVRQVQFYDAALLKDATLIAPTVRIKNISVSA